MADVVQYKLERMTTELDDLEKRRIFSRQEIAEIVKQRRKFEYRLKRPSPLKQDYLSYIDYEVSLDKLRVLRKKSLMRGGGDVKKNKKSVSDYAGVSRIIEIFRLATSRFKGDLELWFRYLEFCREKRNGHMKKVLAQVIRFHPKVPGIWIYAASWQFDHNLNAAAARALMQCGLRYCPTSEALWVEYLRMELTYFNKLSARRAALGEDVGTLVSDGQDPEDKQWRDENKELFMPIDGESEVFNGVDLKNEELKKQIDVFRERGMNTLQAVYESAVGALPSSFSLRTQFLEILEETNLTNSENMRNKILDDMKNEFSKDAAYWDWLAKYETAGRKSGQDVVSEVTPDRLRKAIEVYDEALKAVPSSTIFDLYIKFLMDTIGRNDSRLSDSSSNDIDLVSHVLMVFEKAQSTGCITEDLACQHVSFLLELGRLDDARSLAEKLCNAELSEAVNLWVLRLSIEMRRVTAPSKEDFSSVFDLLQKPLKKVDVIKAESLWLMGLKYFSNQKHYFEKLVDISFSSLIRHGGSDDGFSLSSAIVSFVLQKSGIQSARDMYKRFLALPRPGLAFYRNCIEMEMNIAPSAAGKVHLAEVRKLYDTALSTYDQDSSLWQDYHCMESKMGTSETAAAVQWRARKTLKGNATL
ncbi:U3 small nucleolar RNA-associated protein 6 [Tanacetum coccineum]|uniref:U3 small nucleolar RNA-associated protein 6 n=1 Tax=Tanacetum coccineum TaxID=301880 RepID=A0ABQ5FCU7_9ASTR